MGLYRVGQGRSKMAKKGGTSLMDVPFVYLSLFFHQKQTCPGEGLTNLGKFRIRSFEISYYFG